MTVYHGTELSKVYFMTSNSWRIYGRHTRTYVSVSSWTNTFEKHFAKQNQTALFIVKYVSPLTKKMQI